MIRRPPRSTQGVSSAASDVYKRQAWDNAKKYIEDGKFGGKGSEAHKACLLYTSPSPRD